MKHKGQNNDLLALGAAVSFLLVSGLILASSSALADDIVIDEVSISVPVSCLMSGTGMDSHTDTIDNGTYRANIGTTTLKAYCNDTEGFAIYAVGYTGDEIGGTNSTKLVGINTNETINTGTNTGPVGNTDTSSWAMKLTATTGTYTPIIAGSTADTEKQVGDIDYSNYAEVPVAYAKVAYRNSATDINPEGQNTAEGAILTTTYAAYISRTQVADTYVGKVKYTLVHPATEAPLQPQDTQSGKICYYANASNAVGTMGCQNVSASPTLLASNFSREGYGFAGWSDAYDYATNPNAHFYGPQETIALTTSDYSSPNKGLSLYAIWIKSEGSLQNQTKVTQFCGTNGVGGSLTAAPTNGTANLSSVSALTDQRDNQTYAIAKLADGKCWMIENLRLEADNTRTAEKQALAQGYGTSATYGNFGGLADAENTGFSSTYSANSLYYSGTQEGTASINIGTTNYPAYHMPRYNHENTNSRASSPTTNTGAMYSYGNYYTWHAAIADLTYNGTDNNSTVGTSLCPTGWHLPTGGSVTTAVNVTETPSTWREFYNLGYGIMGSVANDSNAGTDAYYNNTTTNSAGKTATAVFRSFPNNFLYSGYFNTSSAGGRGSSGSYWSSTARNSLNSYYLRLNSSRVNPGTDYNSKYYGGSIRCVSGF